MREYKTKYCKEFFIFILRLQLLSFWTVSFGASSFAAEDMQKGRFPMELNKKKLPIVHLTINNHEDTFIIDTGSGIGLHITDEFQRRIKEKLSNTGTVRTIDLAGKTAELKSYRVDNIKIGNLTFENLTVVELKPWGLTLTAESSGSHEMVLGRDFFKGRSVLFDFGAKYLEITDGLTLPPSLKLTSWNRVPFKMTDEGMIVDLIANGKKLKFVIDTAATFSGVKKSSVSRYQTVSCDNVVKGLGTRNCSAIDLLLAGNKKEHKIPALLIDSDLGGLEADGIIGGNFLYSNRILIDFVGNEIYVSP